MLFRSDADYVANVASSDADLQSSAVVEGTESGTILIGASRERVGFKSELDVAVLRQLARQAISLFPILSNILLISSIPNCIFNSCSPLTIFCNNISSNKETGSEFTSVFKEVSGMFDSCVSILLVLSCLFSPKRLITGSGFINGNEKMYSSKYIPDSSGDDENKSKSCAFSVCSSVETDDALFVF